MEEDAEEAIRRLEEELQSHHQQLEVAKARLEDERASDAKKHMAAMMEKSQQLEVMCSPRSHCAKHVGVNGLRKLVQVVVEQERTERLQIRERIAELRGNEFGSIQDSIQVCVCVCVFVHGVYRAVTSRTFTRPNKRLGKFTGTRRSRRYVQWKPRFRSCALFFWLGRWRRNVSNCKPCKREGPT